MFAVVRLRKTGSAAEQPPQCHPVPAEQQENEAIQRRTAQYPPCERARIAFLCAEQGPDRLAVPVVERRREHGLERLEPLRLWDVLQDRR